MTTITHSSLAGRHLKNVELPVEILQAIGTFLDSHSTISCCLVSRVWSQCFLSVLWRHIPPKALLSDTFINQFPYHFQQIRHLAITLPKSHQVQFLFDLRLRLPSPLRPIDTADTHHFFHFPTPKPEPIVTSTTPTKTLQDCMNLSSIDIDFTMVEPTAIDPTLVSQSSSPILDLLQAQHETMVVVRVRQLDEIGIHYTIIRQIQNFHHLKDLCLDNWVGNNGDTLFEILQSCSELRTLSLSNTKNLCNPMFFLRLSYLNARVPLRTLHDTDTNNKTMHRWSSKVEHLILDGSTLLMDTVMVLAELFPYLHTLSLNGTQGFSQHFIFFDMELILSHNDGDDDHDDDDDDDDDDDGDDNSDDEEEEEEEEEEENVEEDIEDVEEYAPNDSSDSNYYGVDLDGQDGSEDESDDDDDEDDDVLLPLTIRALNHLHVSCPLLARLDFGHCRSDDTDDIDEDFYFRIFELWGSDHDHGTLTSLIAQDTCVFSEDIFFIAAQFGSSKLVHLDMSPGKPLRCDSNKIPERTLKVDRDSYFDTIIEIFESCPSLETLLVAPYTVDAKVIAERSKIAPWVCSRLRHLSLCMEYDLDSELTSKDEQEQEKARVLNKVFGQLSRLSRLETLTIQGGSDSDGGRCHPPKSKGWLPLLPQSQQQLRQQQQEEEEEFLLGLEFRLDYGLNQLSTWKHLRSLNMTQLGSHGMKANELGWIAREWPALIKIEGFFDYDTLAELALKQQAAVNEVYEATDLGKSPERKVEIYEALERERQRQRLTDKQPTGDPRMSPLFFLRAVKVESQSLINRTESMSVAWQVRVPPIDEILLRNHGDLQPLTGTRTEVKVDEELMTKVLGVHGLIYYVPSSFENSQSVEYSMGSILRKVRARFYQGAEEILDVMAESAGFTKVATMAMTPFARYVGYIDPPRFQKGEYVACLRCMWDEDM